MFGDFLQPTHILLLLMVALLVLGPKRLPDAGKAIGKGLRDFRGAMNGMTEQSRDLFDSQADSHTVTMPPVEPDKPEPVMATATSADEPSLSGAATQESPAVAPRNDE